LRSTVRNFVFKLLGKDPDAVVVSFATGSEAAARAMVEEIRRLEPTRRHFTVTLEDFEGYRQLRRRFRGYRIGLAPVLFDGDPKYRRLRRAAFLLAPAKILAYNARLERHHLRLRTGIASLLFLRGLPLDRIFLRPRWLYPLKRDRSEQSADYRVLEGRPFSTERARVAVLSPYFPYPLSHGGAVRIFSLLREAARQFDIVLFAFTEGAGEEFGPVLEFCSKVVLVPKPRYREPRWSTWRPPEVNEYRSATMQSLWTGMTQELDIAVRQVEYTQLASYGGDVLVEHDVTFDLYRQILARERSLAAWWNWRRWRSFELRAARRFERVVVMSEKDACQLPGARTEVIPNGVDLERFLPEPERPGRRLLFIGSFRHFPNIVAFRFFTEQVWPLVRDRFPDMTLTAVAGPDPLLYWREATGAPAPPADPRIRLLGFVREVRPLYLEANLVIVPTQVSAGTNLKVLEAMAMDRAVISTSSGCAGLGLEHGRSIWVADGAEAFAGGIARLFEDLELRGRIAFAARRIAEERFGWESLGAAQRSLFKELSRPRPILRAAGERDLPDLDRIQRASPEAVIWEPVSYLFYNSLVAEIGGRVAGFVVWRKVNDEESEILSLVVDPAFRRRGLGARLMLEVLGGRRAVWFLEVRESNAPARNLYSRLGFEEVGRRPNYYQDTGETAVVMRRQKC
jgi:ribosomal-protein-alanine acetyltransferase